MLTRYKITSLVTTNPLGDGSQRLGSLTDSHISHISLNSIAEHEIPTTTYTTLDYPFVMRVIQ